MTDHQPDINHGGNAAIDEVSFLSTSHLSRIILKTHKLVEKL
jgi:hypothetical protein